MRAVRKSLAIAGLVVLGLIGYQLTMSQITLVDAAQRATALMFALMLLQWLMRLGLGAAIKQMEASQRAARARASAATMASQVTPAERQGIELQREDEPA